MTMHYNKNEVEFLNHMEQEVMRCLPDGYIDAMRVGPRQVTVKHDGHKSKEIIPTFVEVGSPKIFGPWVTFTFDVDREKVSDGPSGSDHKRVYSVTATIKEKGVSVGLSIDDSVFSIRHKYPCGPPFFMDMVRAIMKAFFSVIDSEFQ